MAIEVKIPKEITEYKEKIIFGLSLRQLVCVFIGGIVCIGTYVIIKPFLGADLASDIIIIEAIPIFMFGFIKVRSFNFETYARIFIKHQLGKNKRTYENRLYLDIAEECISGNYVKEEVNKVETRGGSEEYERINSVGRTEKNKIIRERIKRAKKELKEETKRAKESTKDKSKEQFRRHKKEYQTERTEKNTKNKK